MVRAEMALVEHCKVLKAFLAGFAGAGIGEKGCTAVVGVVAGTAGGGYELVAVVAERAGAGVGNVVVAAWMVAGFAVGEVVTVVALVADAFGLVELVALRYVAGSAVSGGVHSLALDAETLVGFEGDTLWKVAEGTFVGWGEIIAVFAGNTVALLFVIYTTIIRAWFTGIGC